MWKVKVLFKTKSTILQELPAIPNLITYVGMEKAPRRGAHKSVRVLPFTLGNFRGAAVQVSTPFVGQGRRSYLESGIYKARDEILHKHTRVHS